MKFSISRLPYFAVLVGFSFVFFFNLNIHGTTVNIRVLLNSAFDVALTYVIVFCFLVLVQCWFLYFICG